MKQLTRSPGRSCSCRIRSISIRSTPTLMPPESMRVTRSVDLPLGEVEFRTSRSSGPGGQHAQKTETRVEAVLDVERTNALTDAQKPRVIVSAGSVLRAAAQHGRSPPGTRALALDRLVAQ